MHTHVEGPICPGCETQLSHCHPKLVLWFRVVKAKRPEVHISEGFRGPEAQHADFLAGKSEKDWPHGKHNRCAPIDRTKPFLPEIYPSANCNAYPQSVAIDLYVLNDSGVAVFPMPTYKAIAEDAVAAKAPIIWGGSWTSLVDGPHFELTKESYGC